MDRKRGEEWELNLALQPKVSDFRFSFPLLLRIILFRFWIDFDVLDSAQIVFQEPAPEKPIPAENTDNSFTALEGKKLQNLLETTSLKFSLKPILHWFRIQRYVYRQVTIHVIQYHIDFVHCTFVAFFQTRCFMDWERCCECAELRFHTGRRQSRELAKWGSPVLFHRSIVPNRL